MDRATALDAAVDAYLTHLGVLGRSTKTIAAWTTSLRLFATWCAARGVTTAGALTLAVVTAYQEHLRARPARFGGRLSLASQQAYLTAVRGLCRWLSARGACSVDAGRIELPRGPRRLPRGVLSPQLVEQVLAQPDVRTSCGLRDRALLELLYSTGLRVSEACGLGVYDVDGARGVAFVRSGKGGRDRVVAVSARAAAWVRRYCDQARGRFVHLAGADAARLFLCRQGGALKPKWVSELVGRYLRSGGYAGPGACHVLRHSMATQMLVDGASVRHVQEQLGHAQLDTTAVYTRVAIEDLKAVHGRTHPAERGGSSAPQCDE